VAAQTESSHLWLLEAVQQAVERAGLAGRLPERTTLLVASVAHGEMYAGLELRLAYAEFDAALEAALQRTGLDEARAQQVRAEAEAGFKAPLPRMTEDAQLGCLRNVAAGRVGRTLGVRGPCVALDAGCASSLAALERAVDALLLGDSDCVIVAGLWGGITAEYLLNTAAFGGTSRSVPRPFDEEADGGGVAAGR
jgi:3-oxoacyl-(acyl-carrier-protein) synthase